MEELKNQAGEEEVLPISVMILDEKSDIWADMPDPELSEAIGTKEVVNRPPDFWVLPGGLNVPIIERVTASLTCPDCGQHSFKAKAYTLASPVESGLPNLVAQCEHCGTYIYLNIFPRGSDADTQTTQ